MDSKTQTHLINSLVIGGVVYYFSRNVPVSAVVAGGSYYAMIQWQNEQDKPKNTYGETTPQIGRSQMPHQPDPILNNNNYMMDPFGGGFGGLWM